MAGALPSEEYQAKLERAGFSQVKVTIVKPHEVNLDIVKRDVDLTPEEFEAAKGAYLADWTHGGAADTFARWIGAAIDTHSRRTPQQRAERGRPRGRAEERTGSTRSFSIAVDTVARMRAAITADQHAGRWASDSAWCSEAIAAAVHEARDQNGGVLPTPPPRLPNRLAR